MLDVHAPEHKLNGVRDFLMHIFTITVGLLIAIGLEQTVEYVHHRHQREEAEAMIRQELEENRDAVKKSQDTIKKEMGDLLAVTHYIDARLAHQSNDASKLTLTYSQSTLKDAAWRTAASTGVLEYMDYATAEQYGEAYKEQEELERIEERAINGYLEIESFVAEKTPDKVSDEDLKAALPVVRQTLANLGGTRDIATGAIEAYDNALKK